MDLVIFKLEGTRDPDGRRYLQLSLVRPPSDEEPCPFAVDVSAPPLAALADAVLGDGAVAAAGRHLLDAVMAHPGVHAWLTRALTAQDPERYRIRVQFGAGREGEALPWEALHTDATGFLGLDPRWPLGRVVDGASVVPAYPTLPSPLSVAVVLSCLRVPAADEWRALWSALAPGGALGPYRLLVLVSEPDLYRELAGPAEAAGDDRLRVAKIADRDSLLAALDGFEPHVLHLFCHGSARGGAPHLELAVTSDWVTGAADSAIGVDARTLRAACRLRPAVTVLNACDTAAPADPAEAAASGTRSLALDLVREGVTAAAIGMREPVTNKAAAVFTRAFYQALARELADRAATSTYGTPIDWPALLTGPRTALLPTTGGLPPSSAAASSKEWTLPVIYTRPPQVLADLPAPPAAPPAPAPDGERMPTARATRVLIDHLSHLVAHLPPDTPDAALGDLRRDLDIHLAHLGAAWPGSPTPYAAPSAATPSPATAPSPGASVQAPTPGR
ncbi:MAG TPA: CHAT domain-containing protein [Streptosporangiaceae bacterium]|jgi:hypothetical protein